MRPLTSPRNRIPSVPHFRRRIVAPYGCTMRTKILDTIDSPRRSALLAGLAVCLVAALAAGAEVLPPGSGGATLRGEYGVLELGSAGLLAAAVVAALAGAMRRPSAVRWCGALLLAALLLRELDFQKRFTYRSIESVGFYTRPIASVHAKILAGLVLATCAIAAWVLARSVWRQWRTGGGIGSRRWTLPAGLASVFVGSALLSEKVLRRTVAEEMFEFAFAGCILALAWRLRPTPWRALGSVEESLRAVEATRPAEVWTEHDERKAA
ncbi:MAG: hypothetical protein IAE82_10875 [Opitutaceae bacterium]|nr:hypothetical protein [Opitutaceae bacterium]